ncbi:MAG: hypothetical protein WB660_00155 [Candidatus Sulfotelmatobacter sp.]
MGTLAQKYGTWSATVGCGLAVGHEAEFEVWLGFAGLVMGRVLPLRVVSLLLLTACGALCQQPEERRSWNSLPDAPSVQASGLAEIIRTSPTEVSSPILKAVGSQGAAMPDSQWRNATGAPRIVLSAIYQRQPAQENSPDFFSKHLYPVLAHPNVSYPPSTSGSMMGRAAYSASRIFVTRDESGRGRPNTSYFLAVLSSAFVHTAYRPYWDRPVSAPFSDFGSRIGNDAGMNLWHEFRPGLQQLVKSHTPKFVSQIEERIGLN